jgi:peptidyl-dipeptidase A
MTFIIYPATDHIVLSFEGIAMKRIPIITILLVMLLVLSGCGTITKEQQLAKFINSHVSKIEPLTTQANYAYWDASTTGKAEDYDRYKKLQLEIRQIYSNRREFAFLKSLKESGHIRDARLARQLDRLYYSYLPNQIDPALMKRIVDLDAQVTEKYNTFRGTIEGKRVTNSDIYKILTTEKDSHKRELAWRASKQVGDAIVADLIELVKLRNQAVRKLGFDNYHTFSIVTGEQSVEELDRIFQQLYELTNEPFANYKRELDSVLADMYGIKTEDLRPWHYHDPFFQRTPLIFQLDLDTYYKNNDVKELARTFYAGVGLPVDDILARSDLYDREGKNPHAFGFDADRKGDVRILANLNNDERWMETILHELGHAIYSKYHDPNEPYLLREPAHSFTTEAIAMFFGRLSRNADWMHQMLNLPQEDYQKIQKISWKYTRSQQVLFARWALVMYHFEKQLYANPDQDLNSLWWELIEKYQYVKRPPGPLDAGWASKLHFTVAPCYYHNYMLGELFASQLHHYLVHNVLQRQSDEGVSYVGEKQAGDYIRRKVFAPGALYYWNDMITQATGEPLTPKYFTEQFLK